MLVNTTSMSNGGLNDGIKDDRAAGYSRGAQPRVDDRGPRLLSRWSCSVVLRTREKQNETVKDLNKANALTERGDRLFGATSQQLGATAPLRIAANERD